MRHRPVDAQAFAIRGIEIMVEEVHWPARNGDSIYPIRSIECESEPTQDSIFVRKKNRPEEV
jgi:hypothetical protein